MSEPEDDKEESEVTKRSEECFFSEEVANVLLFPGHPTHRIQLTVQNAVKSVTSRVRSILLKTFDFSTPLPSDGLKRFSNKKSCNVFRLMETEKGKVVGPEMDLLNGLKGSSGVSDLGEGSDEEFTDEDIDFALRALRGFCPNESSAREEGFQIGENPSDGLGISNEGVSDEDSPEEAKSTTPNKE